MAEVNGERLRELIELRRTTQSALATAIGVTQPTIGRLIDGTTRETGKLLELAAELKTTPEYLTTWSDTRDLSDEVEDQRAAIRANALADRRLGFRGADPHPEGHTDRAEIVWLKEVEQALGAGGGFFDGGGEERLVPFPAHWLRSSVQGQVQSLVTMPCKGTSMEPTILDGNLCIIDTSRQRIDEQDEIWACAFAGLAVIKRLRAMPDGTVKLMSDNQAVRDEIASDGELFILGRCVNVLRST